MSFQGIIKRGPFDIYESLAESWIKADPENVNVLKPIVNGIDISRRPRNKWIIDFGVDASVDDAMHYALPYKYVEENVKPMRQETKQPTSRELWWLHWNSRPAMREAMWNARITRFICTPRVAKHRVFVWLDVEVLPDSATVAIARDDDYFFGVLHSKLHEVWSLRMGTWLGKGNDPRYTPTTTFETFPFPWSPGREDTSHPAHAAISAAAKQLHQERDAWLNPPDESRRGDSVNRPPAALKDRTLTNLYNALAVFRGCDSMKTKAAAANFAPRLDELHRALDDAVCAAYGWDTAILADEEAMLRRLLALNLERARE